jgi:hypothetical protein
MNVGIDECSLFCKFCNGWIIDALDELNDPSPGM